MIEFRDVNTTLCGNPILRSFRMRIEPRGRIFVLGRSGSGKSQFLRHCNGMSVPDSGSVMVHGMDISTLKRRDLCRLRSRMPLVIQSSGLIDSISLRENIAYPLRYLSSLSSATILDRADQAASAVNLSQVEISEMPARVPPGVLKRAAIARALVLDPEAILLDEPATGLDPETAALIYSMIHSLNTRRGMTTIVTCHDPDAALSYATSILFIHMGEILFWGSPCSIMECRNPVVKNFFANAGIRDKGITGNV